MAAVQVLSLALLLTIALGEVIHNANCPASLTKDKYLREYGQHCYQFVLNRQVDWYHASADCVSKGGYLLDIHNFPEQNFIINTVQTLEATETLPKDAGVWIGLTDENTEGNWRWTSGKPMTLTNWASGQPGVIGSMENCGLMEFSGSGQWHDYPCHGLIFTTENHGWVCKFDI